MAATIRASLTCQLSAQKQATTNDPTSTAPALSLNLNSINPASFATQWTPTTTPDGKDAWSGQVTLSGGAASIDLTNLTQVGLTPAVNANGLHVRAIQVIADPTNANVIQIGTGASNGFVGAGVISGLNPGNMALHTCYGSAPVGSTNKTLDLVGTGAQKLDVLIIFGT